MKFSVDLDWHKSKKKVPLPILAAAKHEASLLSLVSWKASVEPLKGSPEGFEGWQWDQIRQVCRFGFIFKQKPQKICQEGKECLLFAVGTKQIFLAKQTFG